VYREEHAAKLRSLLGMVTMTRKQSDQDKGTAADSLVPHHVPVVDIVDQILYRSLHVAAVLVQQLLVAMPVGEAHLNQLVHRSTRLQRSGVKVGDGRRPRRRRDPVVRWRRPDNIVWSPVGLWRNPI